MEKNEKRSFRARLNEKGLEVLSDIKKAVHIKLRRPVSEHQRFRQYLDAASKAAAAAGEDTYEEFMDFGPTDPKELPDSPYELVFDPISGKEVLPAEKIWLDRKRAEFDEAEKLTRKAEAQRKAEMLSAQAPQASPGPQPKKKSKQPAQPSDEDDTQ
nr:MAG: hypothetical protein [Microvirus sp.]